MANLFDLPFEDDDGLDEPPLAPPSKATPDQTASRPAPGLAPPTIPRVAPDRGQPTVGRQLPAAEATRRPSPSASGAAGEPRRTTAGRIEPTPGAATRESAPVVAPRTWSVSQLTARVRDALESEFYEVWVEGELSNCRLWNTGHLYFTLKDSAAQIKGVIFRSALRYLKFKPADGLKVVARGRVSVYEPKGEYQLVCEHLEPQGFGALQLAFEQLKARLQEEGLFDASRKRPLPALPRRIGVVTSLDGAAVRDILKVLGRRHASAHIVIRAARVQGEGAAVEIARGLKALGRVEGVDVIIVARGGGSIEDLWAFNEEIVARAIALSPVPVISAVGHETDVTIADFVADLRAPTPSAAAEIVVAAKAEFSARIDRLSARLRAAAWERIQRLDRRLHTLTARPAFAGYAGRLANRERYVAELAQALARAGRGQVRERERQLQQLRRRLEICDLGRRLAAIRTRLVTADGRVGGAMNRRWQRADARLRECAGRLDTLSPLAVLGRGYAVCWNADRSRIVRDASATATGERVRVTLAHGELHCEVLGADPDVPSRES
jgi:exodeoxyribonuclease VII large subunit